MTIFPLSLLRFPSGILSYVLLMLKSKHGYVDGMAPDEDYKQVVVHGLRVNCVSNQGFLRQYFVSGFFATALGKVFLATVPRVFFHTVSPEPVFLWTSARCCLLRWCFLRQ